MIGFIAAISASLAIIVLVVVASLIGYVQSILPSKGLIKINEEKYRYIMEGTFVNANLLSEIILQIETVGVSGRVKSYQNGCNYGFNVNKRDVDEISTYNYLVMNQFFGDALKVDSIVDEVENEKFNVCFVDINLNKRPIEPAFVDQ